jgi:hypothetical protein
LAGLFCGERWGGAIHHIGNVHKYAHDEDRPEKTLFIIVIRKALLSIIEH